MRGVPRRLIFFGAVGSLLADSFASQSRYSLPNVTRVTATLGSDAVTILSHSTVNELSSSHKFVVVDAVDLEDNPQVVPVNQVRLKRVRGKKKGAGLCKKSSGGKPNTIPNCSNYEGGCIITEEMVQRVPWANGFATGSKDSLINRRRRFFLHNLSG